MTYVLRLSVAALVLLPLAGCMEQQASRPMLRPTTTSSIATWQYKPAPDSVKLMEDRTF